MTSQDSKQPATGTQAQEFSRHPSHDSRYALHDNSLCAVTFIIIVPRVKIRTTIIPRPRDCPPNDDNDDDNDDGDDK